MRVLKSRREIALLRDAGRIAAEALAWAGRNALPGVTTAQLNAGVEKIIRARGATPEFKGYHGFPASICASVNEEIVHGIPGPRVLREGDVISIDVGARYKNFVGDTAWTFPVGEISPAAQGLLDACRNALFAGIRAARPSGMLSEVARAVQEVAESRGFGIVRDYAGHGVGTSMHEDPQVPNYVDEQMLRNDVVLEEGLVLAIEPMLCAGSGKTRVGADRWTVSTVDGSLAAHFEHSIAILADGVEVLTLREGEVFSHA
ncbi:MAG: type I methionyl aminopeptidase [Planctomycetaceae bacterium]